MLLYIQIFNLIAYWIHNILTSHWFSYFVVYSAQWSYKTSHRCFYSLVFQIITSQIFKFSSFFAPLRVKVCWKIKLYSFLPSFKVNRDCKIMQYSRWPCQTFFIFILPLVLHQYMKKQESVWHSAPSMFYSMQFLKNYVSVEVINIKNHAQIANISIKQLWKLQFNNVETIIKQKS